MADPTLLYSLVYQGNHFTECAGIYTSLPRAALEGIKVLRATSSYVHWEVLRYPLNIAPKQNGPRSPYDPYDPRQARLVAEYAHYEPGNMRLVLRNDLDNGTGTLLPTNPNHLDMVYAHRTASSDSIRFESALWKPIRFNGYLPPFLVPASLDPSIYAGPAADWYEDHDEYQVAALIRELFWDNIEGMAQTVN